MNLWRGMSMSKAQIVGVVLLLLIIPVIFVPLNYGWVTNIMGIADEIIAIVVATLLISGVGFLFKDWIFGKKEPDPRAAERQDFRNGVAVEVRSILKMFSDPLSHFDILYPSWSSKTDESKIELLDKDDYLTLRTLYDAVEERNRYFSRTPLSEVDDAESDCLNQTCVQAFSQVYSKLAWVKTDSDIDSLLSRAKVRVGLPESAPLATKVPVVPSDLLTLVYVPLYSAVLEMKGGKDTFPRGGTVGTPLNPWSSNRKIIDQVFDVFDKYLPLIENAEVRKGWEKNKDNLRKGQFWYGDDERKWFESIEKEYHRIKSENPSTRF
jgi:hypothetical protein